MILVRLFGLVLPSAGWTLVLPRVSPENGSPVALCMCACAALILFLFRASRGPRQEPGLKTRATG